jgi:urease accessory protein
VTLNISGGVAGGDRLTSRFEVAADARATIAAQAAERVYRARDVDRPAEIRTTIVVGAGAALEWLPQDTIVFDGAALDRRLNIDLADDSSFVGIESLVVGRSAMGERVRSLRLTDTLRLRRAGRLVLHDQIRLDGEIETTLRSRATLGGNRAVATIIFAGPAATEAVLPPLRAALAETPAEAGASAFDGVVAARIVASEQAILRTAVVAALGVLRDGRPLPRVWTC